MLLPSHVHLQEVFACGAGVRDVDMRVMFCDDSETYIKIKANVQMQNYVVDLKMYR